MPVPKFSFHKATQTYYAWDALEKKRVYFSRDEKKSQKMYREWLKDLAERQKKKAHDEYRPSPGSVVTCAQLALAYWRHRKRTIVTRKDLSTIKVALRFLRRRHGEHVATTFRAKQLKELRSIMCRTSVQKGDETLTRFYVNRLVRHIKAAYTWAAEEDMIPAEAAMSLRIVKGLRKGEGGREKPRVSSVNAATVEATIPHLNHVLAAMVKLQQLAGMRPGELCHLRRRDVSTSAGERVPLPDTDRELSAFAASNGTLVWLAIPESHKTLWRGGKPRVIVLGPRAQAIIAPFLDRAPDEYLFSAREASDAWRDANGRDARYGAGRTPGDHYRTDSYGQAIRKAIVRANKGAKIKIPHWSPNQLRHHAATETSEAFDRATASAVLGNGMDVIDVYVEQELKKAAEAMARIG